MPAELDSVDIWRIRNSTVTRFTWRQNEPIIQRRLDYWLVSDSLQDAIAQFTRRNWNLRTLPHHLLKCVISTLISRLAKTHPSVSASTIRERTLHFALSTFLIWTATFPPILLTVFIHLFQLRLLQRRMMHDPFFIARGALL